MNIIVISTPHQLLQFDEIENYFDTKNKKIILLIIALEPIDSFYAINNKIHNIKVFYLKVWSLRNLISVLLYYPKFCRLINKIKNNNKINNLYLSQYYSDFSILLFNKLNPEKIILLDEGTASFKIAKDRMDFNIHSKQRNLFKRIIYNNSMQFPDHITFFSQYKLKTSNNDNLVLYKFTKKEIVGEFDNDSVIVLGTSMVELNLISLDYYLYLLESIVSTIKKKNIIYYPHRKESISKLKKVKKIINKVMNNNMPFEYYYESQKTIPNKIISFASPVLTNISSKYSLCPELIICKFDTNKLKYNKEVYDLIYDNYSEDKLIKMMIIN